MIKNAFYQRCLFTQCTTITAKLVAVVFLALCPITGWPQPILVPDIIVATNGTHTVINLPQLRLFFYRDGILERSFPIAVGKAHTQTPQGEYTIGPIFHKPTWSVPLSIQKEWQRNNRPVVNKVAPGPNNPLGAVFVRFGDPDLGLGIHGTNRPQSIPGIRSHGCVRLHNNDALFFAEHVLPQSPVSVIYQRILINKDEQNQLWLAIYNDPYHQGETSNAKIMTRIQDWATQHQHPIDVIYVASLLKRKRLQPTCVSCQTSYTPQSLTALNLVNSQTALSMSYDNAIVTSANPQQENIGNELKPIQVRPLIFRSVWP